MTRLRTIVVAVVVAAMTLLISQESTAATCVVVGRVTIEPQDSYYCDVDVLGLPGCDQWKEANLDNQIMPVQYLRLFAWAGGAGASAWGSTDAGGNYSLALTNPNWTTCFGVVVKLSAIFAGVHESDVGVATPRFRFSVGPSGGAAYETELATISLTGSLTTFTPPPWSRTSTDLVTRIANVYYTANSMIREVITWSSNINASLTTTTINSGFRISVDPSFPDGGLMTSFTDPFVKIGYNAYGYGAIIRHEIGHAVHAYVHGRMRDNTCSTYTFFNPSAVGDPRGCEYGSTSMVEAIASFFGTRSLTAHDTRAWNCYCWDGPLNVDGDGVSHFDVCSHHANFPLEPDGDNDWVFRCQPGWGGTGMSFYWLGDFRSSSTANCFRLSRAYGCDCSTYGGLPWQFCDTTYNSTHGYRSAEQISRFFWDMIDTSNDGGQDDDVFTINNIVSYLEGMPCSGNLGGVDGSCEEQAPQPGGFCNPAAEGSFWPNSGAGSTGTRDSYNVYDMAELLPFNQGSERVLNCVQGAID